MRAFAALGTQSLSLPAGPGASTESGSSWILAKSPPPATESLGRPWQCTEQRHGPLRLWGSAGKLLHCFPSLSAHASCSHLVSGIPEVQRSEVRLTGQSEDSGRPDPSGGFKRQLYSCSPQAHSSASPKHPTITSWLILPPQSLRPSEGSLWWLLEPPRRPRVVSPH